MTQNTKDIVATMQKEQKRVLNYKICDRIYSRQVFLNKYADLTNGNSPLYFKGLLSIDFFYDSKFKTIENNKNTLLSKKYVNSIEFSIISKEDGRYYSPSYQIIASISYKNFLENYCFGECAEKEISELVVSKLNRFYLSQDFNVKNRNMF